MENIRLRSLQILYTVVLRVLQNGRLPVNFRHFVVSVIQKYTKFANFASVYVLKYFATKLGNFTNLDMLFLAVVKDFDFLAKMKIQFKRGMVHCNSTVLCIIAFIRVLKIYNAISSTTSFETKTFVIQNKN